MARMQIPVGVLSAAAVLSSHAYAQVFTEWTATWLPPVPWQHPQWAPAVSAGSYAISLDAAGDAYVIGGVTLGGAHFHFAVVKYGPRGEHLWSFIYRGGRGPDDQARAVAADNRGNCYVVGRTNYSIYSGFGAFLTLKCGPRGEVLWVREYNTQGGDRAFDVAVDGAGNAHVTGTVNETEQGGTSDMLTVKYAPDGRVLWERRFDNGLGDDGYEVELDGRGNVYVAGYSYPRGLAILKYSPAGYLLWERYFANGEYVTDLAVDKVGNACVTGFSRSWPYDIVTVKYDPAGNRLWEAVWARTTNSSEAGYALAMARDGDVYVAGATNGGGNYDYVVLKYDSAGRLAWERFYDGPNHPDDSPRDIGLDARENVYVTGSSQVGYGSTDWATLAYDENGALLWEERYDGSEHGDDGAGALWVGDNGVLYVTGWEGVWNAHRFLTIKYVWDGDSGR